METGENEKHSECDIPQVFYGGQQLAARPFLNEITSSADGGLAARELSSPLRFGHAFPVGSEQHNVR